MLSDSMLLAVPVALPRPVSAASAPHATAAVVAFPYAHAAAV